MVDSVFREPVELYRERPLVMADSGAFSAYQSGQIINLDRYGEYLVAAQRWLFASVNLDLIAGSPNVWPTPNECEAACIESYQNWRRLKTYGLETMPVHHQGDDIAWLYRYLNEGARYVGISPNNSLNAFPTSVWQRWMFETLWELEKTGALNKEFFTHGFGVFSARFLPELRDWMWSADSIKLMLHAVQRRILLPFDSDGEPTVEGPLHSYKILYVGSRSPDQAPRNFDWGQFSAYVRLLGLESRFVEMCGRYVARDLYSITSVNAHALRLVMRATGVRLFVAGNNPHVEYQLAAERYPYILRSYASAGGDRDGSMMRNLYLRTLRRPGCTVT